MIKRDDWVDSIFKQFVNKLIKISISFYAQVKSPDGNNLGLLNSNSRFCRLASNDSKIKKIYNSEKISEL